MSTTQIGIGTSSPTGTLQIKGSGSTASTSSLIIQNSLSNLALRIFDNNTIDISTNSLGNQPWFQNISFLGGTGEIKIANNGGGGFFTSFTFGANELMRLNSALQVGIGTTTPNAKLGVRGAGSTSATTSLLVQSSTGQTLKVDDDGSVYLGRSGQTTWAATFLANTGIQGRIGNGSFETPNAIYTYNAGQTMTFYQNNNSGIGFNYSFNNSPLNSSTSIVMMNLGGSYLTQDGAQFSSLSITPTYNLGSNTNTSSIARGIYYNPTITNLRVAQHRAIETTTGDVLFGTTSGKATFGSGVAGTSYIEIKPGTFAGNNRITFNDFDGGSRGGWLEMSTYSSELIFGNYNSLNIGPSTKKYRLYFEPANQNVIISQGFVAPTDSGALFQVKGSGSTSATSSLLVQNSSAVDLLKLQDNGDLTLGTFASGLGKIVVTCDPSYGVKTVMVNNFGGQIIRQVSTDVIWFGGQLQTGLFATGYITLGSPLIYGNNPQGNTTGSSFNFVVTGSPYAQTPSTASRGVLFNGVLNFQSGGYGNYFELSPTYNFDVSNGRIVKGIYYNPTLVNPNTNDKHYGIQTTSGGAYINTTTPNNAAALQVDSTTQGVLFPRMTDAQIRAIASPVNGLVAYNTTIDHLCVYQGGAWVKINHSPM
jgi:hypothetical protein